MTGRLARNQARVIGHWFLSNGHHLFLLSPSRNLFLIVSKDTANTQDIHPIKSITSIMVTLSDGQSVNLCTNEGACAFLAANPQFVSSFTEHASHIIQSSNANIKSSSNNKKLVLLYQRLGVIAEFLTIEQLKTLQPDQLQCLVDFVKTRFGDVSCTQQWRSTGTLSKADQELLDSVVPWLKHAKFVQLMTSSGGFQVIGEMVARDENNKPIMPIPEVAETILMICNNAILSLKGKCTTQAFSNKRALMDLEETGLLGQALRCLTAPVSHGSLSEYLQIVDLIETNTVLLKNKFAPGTPTGDILEGLIAGKDGWTSKSSDNHQQVMKRLKALHKLAILANESPSSPEDGIELSRLCRHCGKTGWELKKQDGYKRLLACSKCKTAYYCDKVCQQADWVQHKASCFRPLQPAQSMVASYVQQNYVAVMTKMKETCVDNALDKKDVFLAIDFMRDDQDISASFHAAPVSQALEGDCPAEPDWFYKGTNVYGSNVALFHEGLRDHHSRMTSNHILVAYRASDGNAGVYRVDMVSEKTGFHICSDEALDLFPQDTLEKKMKLIMLQSGHEPVGGESEEDLKRFMDVCGEGTKM